jgi:Domain of unknown function (DUF4111)
MIGAAERQYLRALVGRLREALEDHLIAVYALGGLALGNYRPGRSDLDVYAVVNGPLDARRKRAVVDRCRHAQLACPARKLELVVISAHVARRPGRAPHWELNLNTGAHEPDHVGTDPTAERSHWFVIDLAIAHQHGVVLLGPEPSRLIGAPVAADVSQAQAEAIAWYARHGLDMDLVTATCRAWYWAQTGAFASKPDALQWCRSRLTPDD